MSCDESDEFPGSGRLKKLFTIILFSIWSRQLWRLGRLAIVPLAIVAITAGYLHLTGSKLNIWEWSNHSRTLRENCPDTEFFLIRIFLHSDWIRRDTPYLSIFIPNAGKYRPEKIPYLDTFHAVAVCPQNLRWGQNTAMVLTENKVIALDRKIFKSALVYL